jgi:hypothetical protein
VAASPVFADTDECAEGAKTTVELDGAVVREAVSNNFGDFVVDGLEPNKDYAVRVEAPGYKSAVKSIRLKQSENLGAIFLETA